MRQTPRQQKAWGLDESEVPICLKGSKACQPLHGWRCVFDPESDIGITLALVSF
jgi:hypothetical protein